MSKPYLNRTVLAASLAVVWSCATVTDSPPRRYAAGTGPADQLQLPAPFDTPSVRNQSKVIGWPQGRTPKAAPGFEVSLFADKLANPRQTYVLPNKDVLVVESIREWPGRPIGRKSRPIASCCSATPTTTANPTYGKPFSAG